MNEFERAKLKRQKNEERRLRAMQKPVEEPEEEPQPEPINGVEHERMAPSLPVPREKQHHGVISIRIHLPDTSFEYTFTKDHVMENVPRNKLTKDAIRNALVEGLKPIFGGVR